MKKKSFIAVLISILVFGAGIGFTILIARDGYWLGIPFLWMGVLAVWAEAINIIVHDNKNGKKEGH